jgi:hypothetical protein
LAGTRPQRATRRSGRADPTKERTASIRWSYFSTTEIQRQRSGVGPTASVHRECSTLWHDMTRIWRNCNSPHQPKNVQILRASLRAATNAYNRARSGDGRNRYCVRAPTRTADSRPMAGTDQLGRRPRTTWHRPAWPRHFRAASAGRLPFSLIGQLMRDLLIAGGCSGHPHHLVITPSRSRKMLTPFA